MNVKLQWATPEADRHLLYIARVSNPDKQDSSDTNLLRYCMQHGHSSPFEMANACLEINTTRDIGRQILRHRSFSFQEFSQRYQDVSKLPHADLRECRMQDKKNRQNSIELGETTEDIELKMWWLGAQRRIEDESAYLYTTALNKGIAKEQARALLPEGLTSSRMYMNGNLRSWIFYLKQRLDPTTQKEHRQIAEQVLAVLRPVAPITMSAFFPEIE